MSRRERLVKLKPYNAGSDNYALAFGGKKDFAAKSESNACTVRLLKDSLAKLESLVEVMLHCGT